MDITIASRLIPFSNCPGTVVIIPLTSLSVKIFPARLIFQDLSRQNADVHIVDLPIRGPVEGFAVHLDLEKMFVEVCGTGTDGFFRYRLSASPSLVLTVCKGRFSVSLPQLQFQSASKKSSLERLSLGCHKKQDWDQVVKRCDMSEIFPFWFWQAQLIPSQPPAIYEGTASLLPACCEAIVAEDKNRILTPFKTLFKAGFEGILTPRLEDLKFQGLNLPSVTASAIAPLQVLYEGAKLIRSMFIQYHDEALYLLKALPTEFHSGRLIHAQITDVGVLSFEWSKKTVKKVHLLSCKTRPLNLRLQKGVTSFRVNRKERHTTQEPLLLQKDCSYTLDCFQ